MHDSETDLLVCNEKRLLADDFLPAPGSARDLHCPYSS
jgi:hypothetical protein